MNILTGWHPYRVLCNDLLIASFYTREMADKFAAERRGRYPRNEYRVTT